MTHSNDARASSASVATSTRSRTRRVWPTAPRAHRRRSGRRRGSTGRRARPAASASRRPRRASSRLRVRIARERVLLAPVDDELRRAAQQLDELGGELAPARRPDDGRRRGSSATVSAGTSTPTSDQPDAQESPRRRAGTPPSTPDARRADRERDERRPEPAEVEALERVDVADHSAEELAAPVALELAGRERLDALVEARADPAQSPRARGRARRGARGSARAAARDRRSGRRRSSTVSERIGGCSAAREIR